MPWDKLSDFVRGVVMPLRNDGAEMQVEVAINATLDTGSIKLSTLEWLEEEFERVRDKTPAPFPYDRKTNTITLPYEIECELRRLVLTGHTVVAKHQFTFVRLAKNRLNDRTANIRRDVGLWNES